MATAPASDFAQLCPGDAKKQAVVGFHKDLINQAPEMISGVIMGNIHPCCKVGVHTPEEELHGVENCKGYILNVGYLMLFTFTSSPIIKIRPYCVSAMFRPCCVLLL